MDICCSPLHSRRDIHANIEVLQQTLYLGLEVGCGEDMDGAAPNGWADTLWEQKAASGQFHICLYEQCYRRERLLH